MENLQRGAIGTSQRASKLPRGLQLDRSGAGSAEPSPPPVPCIQFAVGLVGFATISVQSFLDILLFLIRIEHREYSCAIIKCIPFCLIGF